MEKIKKNDQYEPAKLYHFFIFNTELGQREDNEHEKIMFFWPSSVELGQQQSSVGLAEALINFSKTFSPNKPCEVVQTKKRKHAYFNPEKNIWIVMVVSNPIITRDKGKEKIYQETEVDNSLLTSVLVYAYKYFYFFNGYCHDVIKDDPQNLRDRLNECMPHFLDALDFSKFDIFTNLKGITFMPINRNIYLRVQCFINLTEEMFPSIKYSCFLFGEGLIWSGLELEDMKIIYNYLFRFEHVQKSIFKNSRRYTDEFGFQQLYLNSDENETFLQRVFLMNEVDEVYMIYCKLAGVICIFFVDKEALKNNFCKELGEFISPQMQWMGNVLKENSTKIKVENQNNFIYYNHMNLAIKSTFHLDELPRHVMSTIQTIHQDFERNEEDIIEVIMKNSEDTWVVAKKVDQRELYVYFDLHRVSLLDISEEVKRLSKMQLGNIFIE